MITWFNVDDVPLPQSGIILVLLESGLRRIQVAEIGHNMICIGQRFSFDTKKIIKWAYFNLPEGL